MSIQTRTKGTFEMVAHAPEADLLRAERAARNAEHETEFYVLVTEAQAADLASGYVPTAVKAMVTTMLDWKAEDRRRAARPVPTPRRKKTGGV